MNDKLARSARSADKRKQRFALWLFDYLAQAALAFAIMFLGLALILTLWLR